MASIERRVKQPIYGNRIKEMLEQKGMIQVELADLCLNGDIMFLNKIIHGKKKHISLMTALKIANALNERVEDVFICKL